MKKLIFIALLFPLFALCQDPVVILKISSIITKQTKDTLIFMACSPSGAAIKGSFFTKVSGPGSPVVTVNSASPDQAIVSGLSSGVYVYKINITDAAGATAEDQVAFISGIITPIHDTMYIKMPVMVHDTTVIPAPTVKSILLILSNGTIINK